MVMWIPRVSLRSANVLAVPRMCMVPGIGIRKNQLRLSKSASGCPEPTVNQTDGTDGCRDLGSAG